MSVQSGQTVTVLFTTRVIGGGATNADSLPTGTLYVNGTANAASVTVTNVTTGVPGCSTIAPGIATEDSPDGLVSHIVPSGEDHRPNPGPPAFANVLNSISRQFCIDVAFANHSGRIRPTPLGSHIGNVGSLVPQEKVRGITASGIVARVTDVNRSGQMATKRKFLCHPMRVQNRSAAKTDAPIAVFVGSALPFPAVSVFASGDARKKSVLPLRRIG